MTFEIDRLLPDQQQPDPTGSTVAGILGPLIFLVTSHLHTSAFLTSVLLVGVASDGIWPVVWAMTPDVTDKVEANTGIRSEAVTFSLASKSMKIGIALGAGLMGMVLIAVGFEEGLDQTAHAVFGIRTIMTVPTILGSGVAICHSATG